ncbi:MAG TPA: glutathione S-transferase [Devosiaceae bacterium]
MIQVHFLERSRAHRIVWLLEELGVPYEIVRYERDRETDLAPPELARIHPLGKSPVISDDGLVVAESGAIAEYLVERYGNGGLAPTPGSEDWLSYRYWMHYAEGSAMPAVFLKYLFMALPRRVPFFVRPLVAAISGAVQRAFTDPQLRAHADFWEDTLSRTQWFAGDRFTAADIMMSYPVEAAARIAGVADNRPAIARFLLAIRGRQAYIDATERGGEPMLT